MKVRLVIDFDHVFSTWGFQTFTSEKENNSGSSTKYSVLCSESDYIYESKEDALRAGIAAIKEDGDTLIGYYKKFDK